MPYVITCYIILSETVIINYFYMDLAKFLEQSMQFFHDQVELRYFKEAYLPIAFSSDFSASVALCCTSAAVSATFESVLLAHFVDFGDSASEDFWDN